MYQDTIDHDEIEMPSEIKLPSPLNTPPPEAESAYGADAGLDGSEKISIGEGVPFTGLSPAQGGDVPFYWLENEPEWVQDTVEHRSHAYGNDPSGRNGPASNVLRDDPCIWNVDDAPGTHWIKFNLQNLHEINGFEYMASNAGPECPQQCQLEAMHYESGEWMVVKKWRGVQQDKKYQRVEFAPRTAREWRLHVLSTYGAGACVRHIRFRGRAVLQVPEDQEWLTSEEFDFCATYGPETPPDERLIDTEQLNAMTMAAEETQQGDRSGEARYTVTVYENQRWPPPFSGGNDFGGEYLLPTERGNLSHANGTGDYFWTAGFGHPIVRCPRPHPNSNPNPNPDPNWFAAPGAGVGSPSGRSGWTMRPTRMDGSMRPCSGTTSQ